MIGWSFVLVVEVEYEFFFLHFTWMTNKKDWEEWSNENRSMNRQLALESSAGCKIGKIIIVGDCLESNDEVAESSMD